LPRCDIFADADIGALAFLMGRRNLTEPDAVTVASPRMIEAVSGFHLCAGLKLRQDSFKPPISSVIEDFVLLPHDGGRFAISIKTPKPSTKIIALAQLLFANPVVLPNLHGVAASGANWAVLADYNCAHRVCILVEPDDAGGLHPI
jgi:hypothetical protein